MTRRGTRARAGLALLVLALAFPSWLAFGSYLASRSSRIDLPIRSGEDLIVPLHIARAGYFTTAVEANDSPSACLLGLPDVSEPNPCTNKAETLQFHFRVEGKAGETVKGSYYQRLEGRFPDPDRNSGTFINGQRLGLEFLILEPLPRGDYRLQISGLRFPAELAAANPRLTFREEGNPYEGLSVLPWLLLSCLLGLAAIILLIVAAFTRPSLYSARPPGTQA